MFNWKSTRGGSSIIDEKIIHIILCLNFLGFIASMLVSRSLKEWSPAPSSPIGPNVDALIVCGGNAPYLVAQGQLWRWVTACFLHGDLVHIAINSWSLLVVAPIVRSILSGMDIIKLWVITGILGSVASTVWKLRPLLGDVLGGRLSFEEISLSAEATSVSIGASGALFGLLGFILGYVWSAKDPRGAFLRSQLVICVLINVVIGMTSNIIDNAGHMGGLAGGFLFGRLHTARSFAGASRFLRSPVLSFIIGAVIIASFGAAVYDYAGGTGRKWRGYAPYASTVSLLSRYGRTDVEWNARLKTIETGLPMPSNETGAEARRVILEYTKALRASVEEADGAPSAVERRTFSELFVRMRKVLGAYHVGVPRSP